MSNDKVKNKKVIILGSVIGAMLLVAIVLFFYMTRFSEEDNQIIIDDLREELTLYEDISDAANTIDIDYVSIFTDMIQGYDIRENDAITYYLQSQSYHIDFTIDYIDFWGRRKDRARVVTTVTHADMKYVREKGNALVESRITNMESDRGLILHHLRAYTDILIKKDVPYTYDTVVFKVELVDGVWKMTDDANETLAKILLGKFKYKFLYEDL